MLQATIKPNLVTNNTYQISPQMIASCSSCSKVIKKKKFGAEEILLEALSFLERKENKSTLNMFKAKHHLLIQNDIDMINKT